MKKIYQTSGETSKNETESFLNRKENVADSVRFVTNPDFMLREIAGEAVLIPVGEAGVFENSVISLNETCSFLWKLFQTPRTVSEAIALAKEEYTDPDGVMEQGIYQFVKDYLKYNLLREEENDEKSMKSAGDNGSEICSE